MNNVDELKSLLEKQGEAFQAFKAQHEATLDAERKEREALEMRINRVGLSGASSPSAAVATAEAKALAAFARTGSDAELKGMSVGSDPDGGYLVTPHLSDKINAKVFDHSPIGRLARRVLIDTGDSFEEPLDHSDIGAAWVGESEARPGQQTPALELLRIPLSELSTTQVVTQRLLDDARFNVGEWLTAKISEKFARAEGAAFIGGVGGLQPRGILSYPTSIGDDGARPSGTIQHVLSGANGAFAASDPADCLIDLAHALRAPYLPNAAWLMCRQTAATVRKFKDGSGRFLWAESVAAGQPSTLLGYPVHLDEEMPVLATGSLSIAFGDFQQAYTIIERPGLKLLHDPYTSKPHVLMYAYRRVGGALSNSEAVKLLKFAAE